MNDYFCVTELKKKWDDMTVRATFIMAKGTMMTILGRSGCGKTTLLRMICGITRPDSGSIILDGKDITSKRPCDRDIGMVFQNHALFPHLNVLSNVGYGLAARGLSRKEWHKEASRFLDMVGLAGFEQRSVLTLSGGECQRVALARTLAVHPKIILFDEPLSSLDPSLRTDLRAQIRRYQQELQLTALFVTHDIDEALAVSDKIAVMENGAIIADGTPEQLYTRPPCETVARFFGAGNIIPIKNAVYFVPFDAVKMVSIPAATASTTTTATTDIILPAVTGTSVYAGANTALECTLAGGTVITLRIPPGTAPKPQTPVTLAISRSALVPFD